MPTQQELRELFHYDPLTGDLYRKCGFRKKRYDYVSVDGRTYLKHRVIWTLVHGDLPKGRVIDHINRNGYDNRLENLRAVSQQDNIKNRPLDKRNKCGVPGIYLYPRYKRWKATIGVNGKTIVLGFFDSLDAAIEARRNAETVHNFHPNHGRTVH